jgi:hypothetical protein
MIKRELEKEVVLLKNRFNIEGIPFRRIAY